MDRFVVVAESVGYGPEVYGPFDSEHDAEIWANTNIYVDFTVEPFDTNKMVETNRG